MTTCVLELGRAVARIDNKREREKTRGQTTEDGRGTKENRKTEEKRGEKK
jgi:hypothetical protein